MAMWLLQESSVRKVQVLSRHLKVDGELDDRTSGVRVFQTRAAAVGESAVADSGQVRRRDG